jgi:N5-(carboxyethyl)ornithine synthase
MPCPWAEGSKGEGCMVNIAVIGTSKKEDERRVPIHPRHISLIPENVRGKLFFQKGYGMPFGVDDAQIQAMTGNALLERGELLGSFPVILITKPVLADFERIKEEAFVCGWIHSVQQSDIAQIAIDKRLTLIAWENMYFRSEHELVHIFYKNNEMAGYCGVQHALQLRGIDGNFGPARKISVLSMGSVSRGAVYALRGHGFSDITIYTRRPRFLADNMIPGVRHEQIVGDGNFSFNIVGTLGETRPLIDELASADIIVNGLLQDPQNPVFFIKDEDIPRFTRECLVIDISCDLGMGFSFAHPTGFSNPVLRFGNITYYAVDHTPTLLWDSATWEISNGILPFLQNLAGQSESRVLGEATDIKHGKVLNKDILAYQNRSEEYPYKLL